MSNTKPDPEGPMTIFPPDESLKKRVIAPGSSTNAVRRAVKAAESAIEELSVEFDDWMQSELDKMNELLERVKQEGLTGEAGELLFNAAHDMKGHATTFGYPTVTEICTTLCLLMDEVPDRSCISVKVIEIHVQAIKTIVKEGKKEEVDTKASAISLGLRQMSTKIINHEIRKHNENNEETGEADE